MAKKTIGGAERFGGGAGDSGGEDTQGQELESSQEEPRVSAATVREVITRANGLLRDTPEQTINDRVAVHMEGLSDRHPGDIIEGLEGQERMDTNPTYYLALAKAAYERGLIDGELGHDPRNKFWEMLNLNRGLRGEKMDDPSAAPGERGLFEDLIKDLKGGMREEGLEVPGDDNIVRPDFGGGSDEEDK